METLFSPATAAELMLNLEGTEMNRFDVSGSNLNGVTIPASSSSSTTYSDLVSEVLFALSDRKLAKLMKMRKTKIAKKRQHQSQMQQRKLLQQNQSTQTASQDPVQPVQVAAFIQQNVAKLKEFMQELERQLVAMQGKSDETSESRWQHFVQQLLEQIQHFMDQVNQLPLANKSSDFSTIPQEQCKSLKNSPATDDKISNDEPKGSDICTTAYYIIFVYFSSNF